MTVKKIYTAMANVQDHMLANPIAKTQKNKLKQMRGYNG